MNIDKIVWFIPIRKFRDKLRSYLYGKFGKECLLQKVEVHLAEHCNFSCYSCMHYSNLAKEEYYDINVFENDIKRLKEVTNGKIGGFNLLGGEPLLNKRCKDYFYIVRKYFPNSWIVLTTNAILLDKQDEDFWISCNKNKVNICPTKYPIKINTDKILELANKYNVKFSFADSGESEDYVKYSYSSSFDLEGKQDPDISFKNCGGICIHMKNGRLYICPAVAYIYQFNDYFNVNLEVTEKDYLDLYNCSINDIKKYINHSIPFCRYCVRPAKIVGPWRPSKRVIDEYLYDKN